jgi:hypothetical protein
MQEIIKFLHASMKTGQVNEQTKNEGTKSVNRVQFLSQNELINLKKKEL